MDPNPRLAIYEAWGSPKSRTDEVLMSFQINPTTIISVDTMVTLRKITKVIHFSDGTVEKIVFLRSSLIYRSWA